MSSPATFKTVSVTKYPLRVILTRKLLFIGLLLLFLLLTVQTASAAGTYPMVEEITTTEAMTAGGWTLYDGTSVVDGRLTATITNADAYHVSYKLLPTAITQGTKFRLTANITMPSDQVTPDRSFYVGLAGSISDGSTWDAWGLDSTVGLKTMSAYNSWTMQVPNADLATSSTYTVEMVSDGGNITYTIINNDGHVVNTTVMPRDSTTLNYLFVQFRNTVNYANGGINWVCVNNELEAYNNSLYETSIKFVTYPGSSSPSYIELPKNYNNDTQSRACMAFHGSNGNWSIYVKPTSYTSSASNILFRETIVDGNYIFAVSNAHNSNWGNDPSIDDNKKLYDYLQANFNVSPTVYIEGESMGGISGSNFIMNYPELIAKTAFIYPALNLDWAYTGTNGGDYSDVINTAYSCTAGTYETATSEHNPSDDYTAFTSIPIKIWHGDADTAVGIQHSTSFETGVNAVGGNVELVTVEGGTHGGETCWDQSAILEFYNTEMVKINFTISASSTTITESDTTITLTITKNNTTNYESTVNITTVDGSALAGSDYTPLSETIIFTGAETTKTVVLSIKDNGLGTFPKTFKVSLSNPTGNATLGTPHELTITIKEGNLVHRNTQVKGITSTMNMLWLIPLIIIAMFLINAFMGQGIDMDSMVSVGILIVGIIATIVVAYVIVGNMVL